MENTAFFPHKLGEEALLVLMVLVLLYLARGEQVIVPVHPSSVPPVTIGGFSFLSVTL